MLDSLHFKDSYKYLATKCQIFFKCQYWRFTPPAFRRFSLENISSHMSSWEATATVMLSD